MKIVFSNAFSRETLGIFLTMKSVRAGIFWTNNYIEYESNGDKNKTLSFEEYLNKIDHTPHLIIITNPIHGKFSQQQQLILFLLKTMIKSVQCIQRVITKNP